MPLERRVERQDHERQVGVDEADQHRRLGVQDLQRLGDEPDAPAAPALSRPSGLRMPIQA